MITSNRFQLPEVFQIVDAHIGLAEQRWRAGEYVNYIPSPPESIIDNVGDQDDLATLVPSNETSFEDTLTEENKQVIMTINEANDSGIGNDKLDDSKAFEEYSETVEVNEVLNVSASEEVFEDCIETETGREFDRVDENFSLEMKLALGIDKK